MDKHDLTGMQFDYWTVLHKDESYKGHQNTKWVCRCRCGTVRSVLACTLKSGNSKSCGCRPHAPGGPRKHGMTKTRLFSIWAAMRERCRDRNNATSRQYFGRGIRVCAEWDRFEVFRDWARANGYADNLTIDRIDVNGNYCPENCRWIPIEQQQSNKTNTVYVEYHGTQRCLRSLCVELGFPYKTAHRRLRRAEKAGKTVSTDQLLRPIETKKIAKKYRKEDEI